jgi:hemolysin activation/secretion protein
MRGILLTLLFLCVSVSAAGAQQVEQHSARLLSGDPVTSLTTESSDYTGLDDTPFGVDLSGIVILGNMSDVHSSARANGVDIRTDNTYLTDPALTAKLTPLLGRPLSQRLIGEVRSVVTDYMREQDRPLVAVIVPPQEVTSGTVQLVVIPFVVGEVRVERVPTGVVETSDEKILQTVRVGPGDEVAADVLVDDLAVLNANPFRQVGAVFEPGSEPGQTDLILRVTDEKPWQVFAGYNNNGTQATGLDRLFVGGVWANSAGGDEQVSYQFTASPRTIISSGGLFDFSQDKAFMSHSAAALIPLPWRHNLTLRADYIHTRADLAGPFVQDNQTGQLSLEYGLPLLRGSPSIELFAGAEAKRQRNQLIFSGFPLTPKFLDVVQGYAGVRGHIDLGPMANDFSLKGFFSPGGLTAYNTNAAYIAASGNAGASASYAYLQGTLNNTTQLPLDFHFELNMAGQVASGSLPALEQLGIGGVDTVRGYETNERAGDHGFYVQSELHLPQFSLLEQFSSPGSGIQDREDVYAFADFGMVYDIATGTTSSLLGAGLGIDVAINDYVNATLAWGHAFLAGSTTVAGSDRVHVSITGSY